MSITKPKSKNKPTESLETPPASTTVTAPTKIAKKPVTRKSAQKAASDPIVDTAMSETKKPAKKKKNAKPKVVRDSFSFPEQDYLKISELKKTCLAAGIHVKKGEILRAGLHLLTKLDVEGLKKAVEQVEKVKTGRPSTSST